MTRICLKCNREFQPSYYTQSMCSSCLSSVSFNFSNQKIFQSKHFVSQLPYTSPMVERKPEKSINPLPETKSIQEPVVSVQVVSNPEKTIKRKRKENSKSIYIGIRLTPDLVEPISKYNMSEVIRRALKHYIEKHLNKKQNGEQEQSS